MNIMGNFNNGGHLTGLDSEITMTPINDPSNGPRTSKGWNAWPGVISLAVIALCAAASAIVVGVSNNKEVETWRIFPAVWLAIFSAVSNVAFGSTLATGIAVRFWLHTSEAGGGQLSQLHYVWDHGRGLNSFFAALRAGPTARTVAIMATSAYILQFSSGPLLQRSTRQATQLRYNQQLMFVDVATRIPEGWFGDNSDDWSDMPITGGRRAMSQTQQWYLNSTTTQPSKQGYRCNGGTCLGYVRGAGFTHACSSSHSPLDMSHNESAHHASVFYLDAERIRNSTGHTILQITFSHVSSVEAGCQATINTTVCNITAAIIEYPIAITNSTLHLRLPEFFTTAPPRPISPVESSGDRIDAPVGAGVGPLAGLHNFVDNHFYDDATVEFSNASNRWLYSGPGPGLLADVFFRAEPWDYESGSTMATCGQLVWASPVEYVLGVMYDVMFRVAMRVGEGSERQSLFAEKGQEVLVFRSEWGHLGGAMVAIAVGLGLVGSLVFWGNWRLESPVTLSPLETATLFVNHRGGGGGEGEEGKDALLRQVLRPGARIDEILTEARRMDIRVGMEEGEGTGMSQVRSNVSARRNGRRSMEIY